MSLFTLAVCLELIAETQAGQLLFKWNQLSKIENQNKQILVLQCTATGTQQQSPLGSNPGNISNLFSSKKSGKISHFPSLTTLGWRKCHFLAAPDLLRKLWGTLKRPSILLSGEETPKNRRRYEKTVQIWLPILSVRAEIYERIVRQMAARRMKKLAK